MIAFPGDHGQADAVAGDRVAQRNIVEAEGGGIDVEAKSGFARAVLPVGLRKVKSKTRLRM